MVRYLLEEGSKFRYRNYRYEHIESKGTIIMEHTGRYIVLNKIGEDKKYFRYDLATGEFERVNHYKAGDKVSRTKAKNITSWFSHCDLVTEDKKFSILYKYAKYAINNRYKSIVRFIELFATNELRILEQWLSLGVNFTQIQQLMERDHWSVNHYASSNEKKLYNAPNEYNKEVLEYILNKNKEVGRITFKFVNDCYDHWNNGEYQTFKELKDKLEQSPQYRPLFMIKRFSWDDDYENMFTNPNLAKFRAKVLQTIKEYNLNIDAFLEYALYLNNVESVSLYKLMSDYPDYLRRELHLKDGSMAKMNKYPKLFLTTAYKQEIEYKNIQKLKRMEENGNTEKFDNSIEANKHLEYKQGNYLIRMPKDANDIQDEANQQKHCVASYIPRIEAGETTIMFMRDKDKPEESLLTVEVINNTVTQVYGKNNSNPSVACQVWLTKWAMKNDLKITAVTM